MILRLLSSLRMHVFGPPKVERRVSLWCLTEPRLRGVLYEHDLGEVLERGELLCAVTGERLSYPTIAGFVQEPRMPPRLLSVRGLEELDYDDLPLDVDLAVRELNA